MSKKLENFQKAKEYLICVDSDGCAMDTMDIKHIRCFQWHLRRLMAGPEAFKGIDPIDSFCGLFDARL